MSQSAIITLHNGIVRDPSRRMQAPINFTLEPGEQIALMGLNGSGKTTLIETLIGQRYLQQGELEFHFADPQAHASDQIRYITFRDAYGSADGSYYYQQRWNSADRDQAPQVSEFFDSVACDPAQREFLFDQLQIRKLLHKQIILLSSGELRRFQVARMLLSAPQVLVLESPFIGLDVAARRTLVDLFTTLARESNVQLILSVASPADIPPMITHVYTVEDMICGPKQRREEFFAQNRFTGAEHWYGGAFDEAPQTAPTPIQPLLAPLPTPRTTPLTCQEVVRLQQVTIRYGTRTVLQALDWVIRNGEKWCLSGANGAGKSTLLSLICADNPQAYSQNITLFERRRGSGESIWEIKRHIGYVSPEMHRSYLKNIPAIDIVASGFFDTIGLYRTPTEEQRTECEAWMRCFGIEALRDRSFVKLSSGEQRLLLLARAFVKDPDLLILDEPLHGLDFRRKAIARSVIETFCERPGKTMIYVTHYENELPPCIDHKLTLHRIEE